MLVIWRVTCLIASFSISPHPVPSLPKIHIPCLPLSPSLLLCFLCSSLHMPSLLASRRNKSWTSAGRQTGRGLRWLQLASEPCVLHPPPPASTPPGRTWNSIVRFFSESEGCTWLGALACLLRGSGFWLFSWTFLCMTPVTLLHRDRNSCCSSKPESSKIRSGKPARELGSPGWLAAGGKAGWASGTPSPSSDRMSVAGPGAAASNTTGSSPASAPRCSPWIFRRCCSCKLNFSMQSSMRLDGAFLWVTVTFPQYRTSNFWEL